jgi:hypothetical protein
MKHDVAIRLRTTAASLLIAWLAFLPSVSWAHCDTLDGPVAADARHALAQNEITPVLKWVKADNEGEIKKVFKQVLVARRAGPEAKEVADRYFLETVIRLHRAGEGEPFTGLKPAEAVDPSIVAADRAIDSGSVDKLANELGEAVRKGMGERFTRLAHVKEHKDDSVSAGRDYVAAYVDYVHFVEAVHGFVAAGHTHDARHN